MNLKTDQLQSFQIKHKEKKMNVFLKKRTDYPKAEHNIKVLTYLKMESQREERK